MLSCVALNKPSYWALIMLSYVDPSDFELLGSRCAELRGSQQTELLGSHYAELRGS